MTWLQSLVNKLIPHQYYQTEILYLKAINKILGNEIDELEKRVSSLEIHSQPIIIEVPKPKHTANRRKMVAKLKERIK